MGNTVYDGRRNGVVIGATAAGGASFEAAQRGAGGKGTAAAGAGSREGKHDSESVRARAGKAGKAGRESGSGRRRR